MVLNFKKYFSFVLIALFITGIFAYQAPIIRADVVLDNAQADKARLEAELANLEKEIAAKQKELDGQKGKSTSLSRDISVLNAQIQKSKLDIKAKNLVIQKLGGEIKVKSQKIEALSTKIEKEKESLAQLIRKEKQIEDMSIISLILSKDNISDVYGDINNFASIKQGIQDSVNEIRGVRVLTESEKKGLEEKKDKETDTKYELESAKAKVELSEAEKKNLLAISKGIESEYQKVLAEKARRKSEILAAIFNLVGSSTKINFETALVYAREAEKLTGIDPAFLLAIITKETNLGSNVGQCYLTDINTGNGKGANTGSAQIRVMHPTRDIPVFLNITTKLGIDYSNTRVSCWIKDYRYNPKTGKNDAPFGWGGAMGPAQFIPSTWKMFENRLKIALGRDASPWNPKDAFLASAMYLTDLGGIGNSPSAQHKAACKYYGTGGATCNYSTNKNYTGVMDIKIGIQANIDLLQN